MHIGRSLTPLVLTSILLGVSASAEAPREVEITPADMIEWNEHSFKGRTHYRLTEVDGRAAIHAACEEAGASALYQRYDIDLQATPLIEWSWRVDETLSGIDETTRKGDDYPARVYVVDDRSLLWWRTRAVNYVWASEEEAGSDWPNAYSSRAHMVAVRSGPPGEAGVWHTERRNVRQDFERYHGRRLEQITHVAIMTDCDDTGDRVEGWYGTIRFLPDEG